MLQLLFLVLALLLLVLLLDLLRRDLALITCCLHDLVCCVRVFSFQSLGKLFIVDSAVAALVIVTENHIEVVVSGSGGQHDT